MLMTELADLMDEEIVRELETIKTINPTEPGYARAIEGLSKLYKERVTHHANDMEDDHRERQSKDEANRLQLDRDKLQLDRDKIKVDDKRADIEREKLEIERDKINVEDNRNAETEKARTDIEKEKINVEREKIEVDDKRRRHEKSDGWARYGLDIGVTLLKTAVEIGEIIVPVLFYSKWIEEGLKFEQTGSFTSSTLRTMIGKIKPNGK